MAVQPHFLGSMTLKALLEDPNLKNPPLLAQSSTQLKVKKEDGSSDLPQFNYGSAFLGPNLWEKTYDGLDFNLEYMDLEEFLSENGIEDSQSQDKSTQPKSEEPSAAVNASLPGSSSPQHYHQKTPPMSPSQYLLTPPTKPAQQYVAAGSASPNRTTKSPSPPVSPFSVEFQMTEQDLALSSIPDYGDDYRPKWQLQTNGSDVNRTHSGQEDFDPRKRNFSEEELKPQPILKKSKKVFVPDDLKDEKYWARRHKNNYAAKRSRDARRVKENQIAMRAAFLEKENSVLRDEVNKLRKENVKLKVKVSKYEPGTEIDDTPSSSSGGLP